ncbi:MAG: L-histidine N(alpha)-methyltransferase, partial [Balneolaceae bacterium]
MNEKVLTGSKSMLEEVREGLRKPQKSIPSKYFYDERGSRLFEQITLLEEYYPTRTEMAIMNRNMQEITRRIGPDPVLVELGSGSSKKTRLLLDHLTGPAAYVPVEISRQYLATVVRELEREYPDLPIKPVCADYTQPFEIPPVNNHSNTRYVLFYPGSTIGNFRPEQARGFLA